VHTEGDTGDGRGGDLWIFGYGSLMWRPGFPHDRVETARLVGYHRAFCIYSTHHRGSINRPGLVLGLDKGGVCDGVAFRVRPADAAATKRYLQAREQVNGVYRVETMPIVIDGTAGDRETVLAQAYVVERAHPSYTGRLSLARQAELIKAARGISGCNLDYLINTLEEFARRGVREPELERIGVLAGAVFGRSAVSGLPARPGVKALHAVCSRRGEPAQRLQKGERRRFLYRRHLSS
jgi:glutathione-specific gamma-glutamylcyclotransferase